LKFLSLTTYRNRFGETSFFAMTSILSWRKRQNIDFENGDTSQRLCSICLQLFASTEFGAVRYEVMSTVDDIHRRSDCRFCQLLVGLLGNSKRLAGHDIYCQKITIDRSIIQVYYYPRYSDGLIELGRFRVGRSLATCTDSGVLEPNFDLLCQRIKSCEERARPQISTCHVSI
jgi:hypothetical protein